MTTNTTASTLAPGTAAPSAESLTSLPAPGGPSELRRRITYLMLFRVVLISLVMGATAVLYWASDDDLTAPGAMFVFGIIAFTYLLSIVYAIALVRGMRLNAWKTKPIFIFRVSARSFFDIVETSTPSRMYVPLVSRSRHPMMFIIVDLPDPEGPITATNSPRST